jgi:ubiquinone/menaquinone biosynthesis C-methylase UbiE
MDTMLGFMNGGAMALMCSIGHRTGLFDSLAGSGAVTSVELAETTRLDERYVREWLWAMAAGGVLDYEEVDETFVLPPEHQMLVTRAGGSLNIASALQNIALLGSVEDDVVDSFHTGAGVPYSKYPAFQAIMAEASGARFDAALLSEMIPNLPGAVEALTEGASLADLGCGQGHALLILAAEFPNSTFRGFDFSAESVAVANTRAEQRGLTNVSFHEADAAAFTTDEPFDYITTFDAIHDQAQPRTVLQNVHDALRPGGWYLCVEPKAESALADNLADPMAAFVYTISTMHCMSVSIAGGGEGLGTAWGNEKITEHLTTAGFTAIETRGVPTDRTNTHYISPRS